jgi:hypothetical protein
MSLIKNDQDSFFISRKTAYSLLFFGFLLTVIIRWQALDRPLSFHHEYNTALVLMGVEAWNEMEGAGKTNFVPLISYTKEGDKKNPDGVVYDHTGKKPYLSFGPGWFTMPYLVFSLFRLSPTPFNLHLLNLFFQLLTLLALCRLSKMINHQQENYLTPLICGWLFLFMSAGWLWYFGNGYVTLTMASPFLLLLVTELLPMPEDAKMNRSQGKRVFFDWIVIFLLAAICLWQLKKGLYTLFRNKWILSLTAGIMTGLLIIGAQYIAYAGLDFTISNLLSRFQLRASYDIQTEKELWKIILNHLQSMYLEIFVLLAFSLFYFIINKIKLQLHSLEYWTIGILFISTMFMNLTFLNWTIVHEFSFLYLGFPLILLLSVKLTKILQQPRSIALPLWVSGLLVWCGVTLVHYFHINPSGEISLTGIRYDAYKTLGEQISRQSEDDVAIYLNENDPVMSFYYAKRNFIYAESLEDAQRRHQQSSPVKKAIWFEHQNHKIKRAVRFEKKN